MATITVKNIPDDLYDNLKKVARKNRRSINSEIIVCIERSIKSNPIDMEQFLDQINDLQDAINLPFLTDAFLRQAKNEGRL